MTNNLDALAVAVLLVRELGDDAVTVSRNRLVELTAADNRRAAAFWRAVMEACEDRLSAAPSPLPETGPGVAAHPGMTMH